VRYVDAPVSGGEAGARDGTLTIMAGGDASVVAAVAPVLAPLGRLTRIGPVGSGQLAKLANQIIVGAGVAAVAEALAFARAGGADPGAVRDALIGGFADSTVLREHGRRMVLGDFVPGGSADHQLKDLRTAQAYAEGLRLELPLLAAASALFEAMVRSGDGALDHAGVIREIERQRPSGEARPAGPHSN
jgi:2-hydroxy-3-oxopropionate reductase